MRLKTLWVISIVWTLLLITSVTMTHHYLHNGAHESAITEAESYFNVLVTVRKWVDRLINDGE